MITLKIMSVKEKQSVLDEIRKQKSMGFKHLRTLTGLDQTVKTCNSQ